MSVIVIDPVDIRFLLHSSVHTNEGFNAEEQSPCEPPGGALTGHRSNRDYKGQVVSMVTF